MVNSHFHARARSYRFRVELYLARAVSWTDRHRRFFIAGRRPADVSRESRAWGFNLVERISWHRAHRSILTRRKNSARDPVARVALALSYDDAKRSCLAWTRSLWRGVDSNCLGFCEKGERPQSRSNTRVISIAAGGKPQFDESCRGRARRRRHCDRRRRAPFNRDGALGRRPDSSVPNTFSCRQTLATIGFVACGNRQSLLSSRSCQRRTDYRHGCLSKLDPRRRF